MTTTTTTTTTSAAAAREAATVVRQKLAVGKLDLAIILGSGLGGLVEELGDARQMAYAEIPGFPSTAVSGHSGTLHVGTLAGREVVALAGRFHMYEGHAPSLAGFPVRVLHALGAPALLVTNAAGGVRRTMRPGDLMIIADQINMMWQNPLVGKLEPGDERFPDMSDPYDPQFRELLRSVMLRFGIPLVEGVYLGLSGPTYETPAEVRMLEKLGADAVGMSTIPEVVVARAIGMRVAGISCITNLASGITSNPLSHQEVLDVGLRVQSRFRQVVRTFVELI